MSIKDLAIWILSYTFAGSFEIWKSFYYNIYITMEFKKYVSPEIEVIEIVSEGVLCNSGERGMSGYAGDSEDSEF